MARPDELVVGNCYFTVKFHDRDLLFPYISTLKFLGCESDEKGERLWLFDEPTDIPDSEEAQSQDAQAVLGLEDEHLYQVLDFHGLQRELAAVAVDHPLSPIPKPEGPAATLPPRLDEGIRKFLSEPQHLSVTVTILFTDDGLSISRREDGVELSFFAHPRRDPQEEGKIRALFGGLGIAPHVDYLADKGRTRVLGYAAPEGPHELTALCGRILREVYAIRGGDTLKFDFHPRSDPS